MLLKDFKTKLNIKADTPTFARHVYPKAVLEATLPMFAKKFIYLGLGDRTKSVIGAVSAASLTEDGEVMIEGQVSDKFYEALTASDGALGLSLCCTAKVEPREDGLIDVKTVEEVHRLNAISRRMLKK